MSDMRLGDHCEKVGSGATPRGGKDAYLAEGPYSLIRSQNVHNDGFDFSGLAFISEEQARKLNNVEVRERDVLVNITGDSVARACCVHRDALPARVNQHVAIIRPRAAKVNPLFLRYWLVTPTIQALLLGLASAGATRPALTKGMLEDLRVPALSIDVQRAIAETLGALDDKIELNRQTNQTLEAMAQAIFRDWFVDFGPTRRKIGGETDPLNIMGGLISDLDRAQEVADLFPMALGEDGLPDGWEAGRLERVLAFSYGKSLTKHARQAGPFPVYGSGGITGWHNQPFVKGPSIIVGRKGTVGSLHWEDRDCHPIDTVFFVKPHAPLTYCYYLLETLGLEHMNTDAAVPGLNRENVYRIQVPIVPRPVTRAFDEFAKLFRQRIAAANAENNTLAATRDFLLPKLMSGGISLGEIEQQLEAAE